MSDKLIEARVCAWCGQPYTPNRYKVATQKCCSAICARKHGGMKRRGQVVPQLVVATQKRAALRQAQQLSDQFGMLSPRERELFRFAYRRGYVNGYNAGTRPVSARVREENAA